MKYFLNKDNRKEVFLIVCWALYDLANQFFALNVISVYFPRWLTLEKNSPEILYSLSFGFSMFVVSFFAPFLGTVSDMQHKKKIYLINFTFVAVFFTILLGLFNNVVLGLICFALANVGCQVAIVFYNALIVKVARKETVGLVSGIGRMFAYCGAILALYLSKPVITRYGYQMTFIMTGSAFLLFSLPAMIFIKEDIPEGSKRLFFFFKKEQLEKIFKRIRSAFSSGAEFRDIRKFLMVFFFILCALQTMMLFMSVYIGEVFKLSESEIINLIIFSTLFAIGGSLVSGLICDRLGNKRSMIGVFCLWFVAFFAGAFLRPPFQWLLGALVGFTLSSTWVVARAWAVRLVPEENIGEIFGLFNLMGYLAGMIGPLYWGVIRLSLSSLGEWGYRLTLLSLLLFVGVAFYHLLMLPEREIGSS